MTMGLDCCCPKCTVTMIEGSPGGAANTWAYWSTHYRQMAVVLTLSIAGSGSLGAGCPNPGSSGWVLHTDGTWGDPAVFRRWTNADGNDAEIHFTNSGGTLVTNYVRIWNSAGDIIIDKSSGSWVLSGTCAGGFVVPCNWIFGVSRYRYQCLRATSRLPITATMTGSGIVTLDAFGGCGPVGSTYTCVSSPDEWANATRSKNIASGTTFADGLVSVGSFFIEPSPPLYCDTVTPGLIRHVQTITLTQGASPNVNANIYVCGDVYCTDPFNIVHVCRGNMTGDLNMTSNTTQSWWEDFSQVVDVADVQGHTGTMAVEIPW